MSTSKTARASMVKTIGEKKVIPDEVYIKNLRYDVNNGIHATQEGTKALLRAHDATLNTVSELNERVNLLEIDSKSQENLIKDLIAANEKMKAEIAAAQEIFGNAAKIQTVDCCNDPTLPSGAHVEGCPNV